MSALMGVHNFRATWIGWPGVYVEEGPDRDALTAALGREGYLPVYLEDNIVDLHYNGFCNSVLWALFHYVPLNIETKLSQTRTLQFQWAAHQEANRRFSEAVCSVYQEGDVVWVQDYHLMLLPAMLKKQHPKMKVGWFLHTPFPSSEIYRTLPVREEVLRAVLKADLIGFHTYDYARHFVSAGTRILGLEGTPEGVEDNGSLTRVAAFPIGIDPERFAAALEEDSVKQSIARLLKEYDGRKVMLGVDRLDMIKGIPQKLLAFEKFLEENPGWRNKVLLVQIAVPSRTDVPEYQRLRSMVHEIVGRINGKYGTLTENPIHHLDRQLSFHELCALYAVTDVALVTSLRDGMNLVSYEYVACQSKNAGVLVLSEFAGAAQSLGAGAILVNPWNITDMASAIEDALTMSEQERRERHRQNFMHITIHTSQTWADTFISELNDTHVEAELRTRHIPPLFDVEEAVHDYQNARRKLLVFGYNATLTSGVELQQQPKRQFEHLTSMARVNPQTYNSIKGLSDDRNTVIVIFSGSGKEQLEETFGRLNVWLAAENGIFMRRPPTLIEPEPEWVALVDVQRKEWMDSVGLVFDYFRERTPRSFVEAREASIVWNYRSADIEFGRLQARDLLQHLWTGPISNAPVDIVQGSKSVEVRPVGISKGVAMQSILAAMVQADGPLAIEFDYVLVVGHFLTRDENIFTFFEGHTVLVGKDGMKAALSVMGSSAVSLPGLAHGGASLQRLADGPDTQRRSTSSMAGSARRLSQESTLTAEAMAAMNMRHEPLGTHSNSLHSASWPASHAIAEGFPSPRITATAPGFVRAAAAAPCVAASSPGSNRLGGHSFSHQSTGALASVAESGGRSPLSLVAQQARGTGPASPVPSKAPHPSEAVESKDGDYGGMPPQSEEPPSPSTATPAGYSAFTSADLPYPETTSSSTAAMFPHHSSTLCSAASGTATNAQAPHPALERAALATGLGRDFLGSDPFRRYSLPANINYKANFIAAYGPAAATSSRLANMTARRRPEQLLNATEDMPTQPRAEKRISIDHIDPRAGIRGEGLRRISPHPQEQLPPTPRVVDNVFFNAGLELPIRLPPEKLYTCTVGRQRSQARGFLNSSADVGILLAKLANRSI